MSSDPCCEELRTASRVMWGKPYYGREPYGWYLVVDEYGCASCGPTREPFELIRFCPFCGGRFNYE